MNISGILLAGMAGLFALAMGYVVIFVLYQRRMISRDLEKQKWEIDHQKKLLQVVIESQEAERKRIAHDLHDDIGALLTTSRLYFNQLSPGYAEDQLKVVSNKMNILFDEMMSNIRHISHDLRPVVLENLGLIEAIECIRHKLTKANVSFYFAHQFSFIMTMEAELILYRIIQEFINNTLKHAQASHIRLLMEEKTDQLCLSYRDDGIGFVPNDSKNGLGLKSIESRLSLMETSLQRVPVDNGVAFVILFPLKKLMKYEKH